MDIKPTRKKQLRQGAEESETPVPVQRYLLVTQEPNRLGLTALGLSVEVVVEDVIINVDKTRIYATPPSREFWIRRGLPFPKVVLVNTDLHLGSDELGFASVILRSKLDTHMAHYSVYPYDLVLSTRGPWQYQRTAEICPRISMAPLITGAELEAAAVSVYDQPHSDGLVQLPKGIRGLLADRALIRRQLNPRILDICQLDLEYDWLHASEVERNELKAYRKARSSTRRQTDHEGL